MESFDEAEFEAKLYCLKESHDSIAGLSSWCLSQHVYHRQIVSSWLQVFKKARNGQKLTLLYLANDIIQYSKRMKIPFVYTFASVLKTAVASVKKESVKQKMLRVLKVWEERAIYRQSFLKELVEILAGGNRTTDVTGVHDFQAPILVSRIRDLMNLEMETSKKLRAVNDSNICPDETEVKCFVKEKTDASSVLSDLDKRVRKVKEYINAVKTLVTERRRVINLLETAEKFYQKENGEAKTVANAYKCFGGRVKSVKKSLDAKLALPPSPESPPLPTSPNFCFSGVNFSSGCSFLCNGLPGTHDVADAYEGSTQKSPCAGVQGGSGPPLPATPPPLPPLFVAPDSKPYLTSMKPIKFYTPPPVKRRKLDKVNVKQQLSTEWDSPQSPPMCEKPSFSAPTGINSQVRDLTSMDGDTKNITRPAGAISSLRSLKSDELCSSCPAGQDNIENVDMDLSEDEEKQNEPSKTKEPSPYGSYQNQPEKHKSEAEQFRFKQGNIPNNSYSVPFVAPGRPSYYISTNMSSDQTPFRGDGTFMSIPPLQPPPLPPFLPTGGSSPGLKFLSTPSYLMPDLSNPSFRSTSDPLRSSAFFSSSTGPPPNNFSSSNVYQERGLKSSLASPRKPPVTSWASNGAPPMNFNLQPSYWGGSFPQPSFTRPPPYSASISPSTRNYGFTGERGQWY